MAYPRRLLNDHETIAVDLHPHWWYFAGPTIALLVSIGMGIMTLASTDVDTAARTYAGWGSLVAIVISASWVAIRYAKWTTTHFVITSRRVIFRSGLITKHGIEIPLDRVNTVNFHQGVFERMVGAGDILVESGGESGQQRFTDIRQPDRVQRAIHAQIDALSGRSAGGLAGGDQLDVADQLERLEGMVTRGTLTDEEFAIQKRRLLGN